MGDDKIVQFVCFETTLDTEPFVTQWEQYTKSGKSNEDITMQQSKRNGSFRYIAQHRSVAGEFKFAFTKSGRSSQTPEPGLKAKQAGGYSVLQAERKSVHADENKVFVFLADPLADLTAYKQLSPHSKLNIYEAYYENCQYAYILEFIIKNKYVEKLLEQLKEYDTAEVGSYKEFNMQAS